MPQIYRAIRPMFKSDIWRICRDDIVYITRGPEKGKTGKVLEVFKDKRVPEVVVEGLNLRKKKVRTGPNPDDFFVVTMEAPLHYCQVQLLDPQTRKPVRVTFRYTPEGDRVRVRGVPNPTVNDILPSPPEDPDPRAGLVGRKDTPADVARKATFLPATGFPFRPRNLERIWASLHPDASPLGDDDRDQDAGDGGAQQGRRRLWPLGRSLGAMAAAGPQGGQPSSSGGRGTSGVRAGLFGSGVGVSGNIGGAGGSPLGGGVSAPGAVRELCTAAAGAGGAGSDAGQEGAGSAECRMAAAGAEGAGEEAVRPWFANSFALLGLRWCTGLRASNVIDLQSLGRAGERGR